MKEITLMITLGLILLTIHAHSRNRQLHDQAMESDTIVVREAVLFCKVNFTIHGIAFDNQGLMYLGGGKDIYTINPEKEVKHFITLNDTTENTIIWSLRFGPDHALYVAAKDRVLKISPEGEQTIIIKETFPGPAGVTDVRFDQNDELLIVYDNMVEKCDSGHQRKVIIDGSQFEPPLEWIVGIEFSSDFQQMYLGDCSGKHAYVIPILTKIHMHQSLSYPTNWGQYFTRDHSDNVYITSLGTESNFPDFVMFTPENRRVDIFPENRVPQYRGNHKKTIAWGKKGFDEHAIYCIIGNSIYAYDFRETIARKRKTN